MEFKTEYSAKLKTQLITLLFATILVVGSAKSQESANTAGGNGTGAGGSVSYSVGQVAYTTNTSSSGNVAQGVQHAYEIFTVGLMENDIAISLTAFPNPTIDNLIVQVEDVERLKLKFQLFDAQGRLVNNGELGTHQTIINMSELSPAVYFINVVTRENKTVKSFKIIKK